MQSIHGQFSNHLQFDMKPMAIPNIYSKRIFQSPNTAKDHVWGYMLNSGGHTIPKHHQFDIV